jgi:hypothetical protein
MHIKNLSHVICTLSLAVACSSGEHTPSSQTKEAWDAENSPTNFGVSLKRLADLPLEGSLPTDKTPWSGDYWASYRGGISDRWQTSANSVFSDNHLEYRYPLMDLAALKNSSQETLDKLSPAEKYDIAFGRYHYPLVKEEWHRTEIQANPKDKLIPGWYGLCHGWAPATIAEKEPGAFTSIKNGDGITVNFNSADLKALLVKVYSDGYSPSQFIGNRCETDDHAIEVDENNRVKALDCRDVNPGAMHLVLAEFLGHPNPAKRQGFVIDKSRGSQVWNQGVSAFKFTLSAPEKVSESDVLRKHRAPGTTHIVKVDASISYVNEYSNEPVPVGDRPEEYISTFDVSYTLELDEKGTIIGGEWISDERPDFMWRSIGRPVLKDSAIDSDMVYDIIRKSYGSKAPAVREEPTMPSAAPMPMPTPVL